MRTGKNTFDWTVSRQKENAVSNRPAEKNFLEFFLAVLFFVLLVITVTAFLFFSPLLIISVKH